MARNIRILGNNLNQNKKVKIALTTIYGIGMAMSKQILNKLNIDLDKKVSDLSNIEVSRLRDYLESGSIPVQGNLKRIIYQNIKRLVDIKCYRGIRHTKGLPLRGQRTRTNSRTCRVVKNIFFN